MKKLLSLLAMAAFTMPTFAADLPEKPETKKACIKTVDAKTKKEVEKCKIVKVHKKHEGTKVPDKAPAKK